MQIKCMGLASIPGWMFIPGLVPGLIFAFSLASIAAISLEPALQACQSRVEEELPGTEVSFRAGSTLPNGTLMIQWETANITGSCRVDLEDYTLVEFVNPYAVPRGQRPIENVVAFQTQEYTVRIVRLVEQLYMNVYNRRTDRVELNRASIRITNSEDGTVYTTLLGQRHYRSIVSADGAYRLVISLGDEWVIYDQVGTTLENAEAINSPQLAAPQSASPLPARSTQD